MENVSFPTLGARVRATMVVQFHPAWDGNPDSPHCIGPGRLGTVTKLNPDVIEPSFVVEWDSSPTDDLTVELQEFGAGWVDALEVIQ